MGIRDPRDGQRQADGNVGAGRRPRSAAQADPRLTRLLTIAVAAGLILLALPPLFNFRVPFFFYVLFWISMASAFNIIFGLAGYLPFGFVAFYGVGAYSTAYLVRQGVSTTVAVGVAGLAAMLLALLFSPTLRLRGVYFAIVNFACALALRSVVANVPSDILGGSNGLSLAREYSPTTTYFMMLAVTVGTIILSVHLSRSRLGIALRALKQDVEAAEVVGVNTLRAKLTAWVLSALIPGLCGGLDTWFSAVVDPDSGFQLQITAKTVLYGMFGGFGTVAGPILGSVVFYTIDDMLWVLFPMFNVFLVGLVLLLLILFLPRGIVGELLRRYPTLRLYLR